MYGKFILVLLTVRRKGLEVVAVGEGVCEGVRERGPRDVSETQYWGPVLSRGEHSSSTQAIQEKILLGLLFIQLAYFYG